MKVAAIEGERNCRLVERPLPVASGDLAVVRVDVAPMCTEFHAYTKGWQGDCLGHEAADVVVDAGQSHRVNKGDRVVVMPQTPRGRCDLCITGHYIHCENPRDVLADSGNVSENATFANYLLRQDGLLLQVPEPISLVHASMACCGLGPTFQAVHRMNVTGGDSVVIVGLGPVGLGGVINCVHLGARVIAGDSNPYRDKLAQSLGAQHVLDPADPDLVAAIQALTRGRGADKAIECTGISAAQSLAIQSTCRCGEIAFVGWGGKIEYENPIPPGLTLHTCWHYPLFLAPAMFRVIAEIGPQLGALITHRFPMTAVEDAWKLQLSGQCGKVILTPHA